MEAAFELMSKLGVRYWTFHDRDIAPEGRDLAETNANLDVISDLALELQKKTGIKCLWGTANLFSHPRYANGAATNPSAKQNSAPLAGERESTLSPHSLFLCWRSRSLEGTPTCSRTLLRR